MVIKVDLRERSYNIYIQKGIFDKVIDTLYRFIYSKKAIVISDDVVFSIYGDSLLNQLNTIEGSSIDYLYIKAGEENKNLNTLKEIYNYLALSKVDRKSVILSLGGGVVGDIAGFAAATYMRGIDFIQIPTTLLAMVDSSVGGKSGVNLPQGKNLVGAFWQPNSVIIDPNLLNTLALREIKGGLGEVVKYGVIADSSLLDFIIDNSTRILNLDGDTISNIIAKCCKIKASIVTTDEREHGIRAFLNYGHTFAHAIEKVTYYRRYLHGEAVSIGCLMAAKMALNLGLLKSYEYQKIYHSIDALGLVRHLDGSIDPEEIYTAMYMDKKKSSGKLFFILPTSLGQVSLFSDIDKHVIITAIKEFISSL